MRASGDVFEQAAGRRTADSGGQVEEGAGGGCMLALQSAASPD